MRRIAYLVIVMLFSLETLAQQRTITSKVSDINNTTVIGATITVKFRN